MRKTGNRFRKMDEKPLFPGTINGPGIEELSGGLRGRAVRSPTA